MNERPNSTYPFSFRTRVVKKGDVTTVYYNCFCFVRLQYILCFLVLSVIHFSRTQVIVLPIAIANIILFGYLIWLFRTLHNRRKCLILSRHRLACRYCLPRTGTRQDFKGVRRFPRTDLPAILLPKVITFAFHTNPGSSHPWRRSSMVWPLSSAFFSYRAFNRVFAQYGWPSANHGI